MQDKKTMRTILVVSTMSSGKSTLINAMLGENILLSRNEACTSKSYYIMTNKNIKNKLQIRLYKDNNIISSDKIDLKNKDMIKKCMSEINLDETINKVELSSNFKNINNLSIIDTPGTNNSLDETHMKKTIDMIKHANYDNILYILNATQLATNDDRELLEYVKKYTYINQEDIIFVLNKVDELDIEQDEDLNSIYENCKNYLKSIGFQNPIIFMTSAYLANLKQKIKNKENLTKREIRRLNSLNEIFRNTQFNLDVFNKIEYTKTKSIIKRYKERDLNGTGIIELRNYLAREEK